VRFAQEVGRGLRACPEIDKSCCYQLDIHDLYSIHSIDWRAALGEVDETAVPALQLDLALERATAPASSWGETDRMPAALLSPLRSWIRSERVRAQFEGRASLRVESTHWRSDPVSRRQARMIFDLMSRLTPAELGEDTERFRAAWYAVRDAVTRDPQDLKGALRKGDASDLIVILRGIQ